MASKGLSIGTGLVVVGLVALTTGCATKGHVRNHIDEVNGRIDEMAADASRTRSRIGQTDARLGEVDRTAHDAGERGRRAQNAADSAGTTANEALDLANRMDRSSRRLVYEVVLDEAHGNFAFNNSELPVDARSAIDDLVVMLQADPASVYFEIEGHTDSTGPAPVNDRLGLQRAEAVKSYLYNTHAVPLHKINVISYGEEYPIAPNTSVDGRAQNRRVVIRVVS